MIHICTKTHSKLSTVMVAFNAGSRTELSGGYNSGIAHMLEHCIFKGTNNRNWMDIQKQVGFLGADINAFTSHETVAYYITVPYDNVEEAVKILADIVLNSTIPEEEFLKEKEVVKEEEISRLDDVSSFIWNRYSNRFFDNYLAKPVIGTQDSISSFSRDEVFSFYRENCSGSDAVVSICSSINKKDSKALLRKYFGSPTGKISRGFEVNTSSYKDSDDLAVIRKGIEHTYVWMGYPGLVQGSKENPATALMMCILGSGMDSRLFTEVREKRGLAYSVGSNHNAWQGGGLSLITSSTREANLGDMIKVINDEVSLIKSSPVTSEELQRAKNKVKAYFYSVVEDSYGMAYQNLKRKLHGIPSLEDYSKIISEVSVEDIMNSANLVFDESKRLTLVCRGG